MKIGILTFHTAANYGAVLQAYALTKAFKKFDVEVELINYENSAHNRMYRVLNLVNFNHPKAMLMDVLSIRKKCVRNREFCDFRKNFLNASKKIYDENILPDGKEYDLVVSGSDQVWSFDCNCNDTHYFLDMIDSSVPCVSYAASMSKVSLNDKEKQLYKKLLKRFSHISVREEQARELLQPLTDKKIVVSPDPTFLLTKEDWSELATEPKKENYIFAFSLILSDEVMASARELAKLTGCKLVCLNMYNVKYEHRFGTIFPCSPNDWLGYIKNAKYVVTDSFHGTAFSVIFQKNFISLTKNNAGRNTRIVSMLKKLGLEDRIVSGLCKAVPEQIDYKVADERFEDLRKDGLSYIKKLISEIEKGEF